MAEEKKQEKEAGKEAKEVMDVKPEAREAKDVKEVKETGQEAKEVKDVKEVKEVKAEEKGKPSAEEAKAAAEVKPAEKEEKPAAKAKEGEKPAVKKKRRSRKKGITAKAKKKRAVARAVIKKGSGKVTINKRDLSLVEPAYARQLITEPLKLAGDLAAEVNITVDVRGGGNMGHVVSVRGAIAKALVEYSRNDRLRQKFLGYDRTLLVDDVRKIEPKKPLGPKARKKKQKSKR